MATVTVCGWACLDERFWVERFPPTSARTDAHAYREALGGPGAVAAQAIARLGGVARFVGVRGSDDIGARLAAMLQAEGVDVSAFAAIAAARSPVSAVLIDPTGERRIFRYVGERLSTFGDQTSAVAGSAAAVLVDVRLPALAAPLVDAARAAGIPAILDMDRGEAADWSLAARCTHVVADEELALSSGGADALLDRLRRIGVWGAVTLGARGVVSHDGSIAAPTIVARDSTGAGDVFHGAFALALAEGASHGRALRFASAAGAQRCALGDVPRRQDVLRLLEATYA